MRISTQKICVTIFLLLIHSGLSGQKQKEEIEIFSEEKLLTLGFSLGLNLMDFVVTPSLEYFAIDSLNPKGYSHYPGVNINFIANFKIGESFDIRLLPGACLGQRIVSYNHDDIIDYQALIESSFVECPVLLKYSFELNGVNPYLIGGLNYRYDFNAKEEYDEDSSIYLRLRESDVYYEIGTGLELFRSNFKLSIEIKMSNGFRDILVHEPHPYHPEYCDAIEKMKSRIWVLSFQFE